jgi:hypothetical protein
MAISDEGYMLCKVGGQILLITGTVNTDPSVRDRFVLCLGPLVSLRAVMVGLILVLHVFLIPL